MRVHAQERTRAGACARRSRTAPPSSLPLRGEAEPEEGGASEGGGNAFKDGRQSTVGKNGQDGLRGSPKKNTSRGPEQAGLGSAEAERSP